MRCRPNEHGIALVVALLITLIIAALSAGLSISSQNGARVATAFKNQQTSFEAAVAGLEHAREKIRAERFLAGALQPDYDVKLATVSGGDLLVNSTTLSSFGTTNGAAPDGGATNDTPELLQPNFDSSAYRVFLTNGGADVVTSTDDTDDIVTLTSFASAANQAGFSVVQAAYRPDPLLSPPTLPGLLTMPGPSVVLNLPNGAASQMAGSDGRTPPGCYATVAVTTSTAEGQVDAAMTRDQNYTTCNPAGGPWSGMASVDNFLAGTNPYDGTSQTPSLQTGDPRLVQVPYLLDLVQKISTTIADYVGPDTGSVNLGTATAPRINVITGNFNMGGNTNGSGVLVVTGNLTMNGTPGYRGTIYVIGTGFVQRRGGGNGVMNCGGMLIANTNSPFNPGAPAADRLVGIPTYLINGGGNSEFRASCPGGFTGAFVKFGAPLIRLSFQQLR